LARIKRAKEIHVAGGISENICLKVRLEKKIDEINNSFILRYPVKREYRLDNAAMIGCLGYFQQKYKIKFRYFTPNITI
jgi:tRNA A37 threonylcarbamoyltransferase TsaD